MNTKKHINKAFTICCLVLGISLCSSISFSQESKSLDAPSNAHKAQAELTPAKIRKSIQDSSESPKPVEVEIVSMPQKDFFINYSIQILTGGIVAFITFVLTLGVFRIQQSWQEKRTKQTLEKQKYSDLIIVLTEMKRAIDRCQSLSSWAVGDEQNKSFSMLYVKAEEIMFLRFFKLCDRYDIINKILATYSLFKWVNWNIDLGIQLQDIDQQGKAVFRDRYKAAVGFIQMYLWGAAKNFNEVLDYAKELEKDRVGVIPDFLVSYNLTEIEKIRYIKTRELQ